MFKYADITGEEPNCPCCNNCRLIHITSNKWDCERCKKVFRVERHGNNYPSISKKKELIEYEFPTEDPTLLYKIKKLLGIAK